MELGLKAVKSRSVYEINKGFALILINQNYKHFEKHYRADADRIKIKKFCENVQFTVNETKGLKTDDLTADEMGDLFKAISKRDFSSYDAFICFILSHCDSEGILGVDGDSITVKEIVRSINRCASLAGKPKLFFIQSCRGYKKDTGLVVADTSGFPRFTTPIEADILVAYSNLDGYEFSVSQGSWYITALTKVLNEYAHRMNLTDMLAIVNQMVASTQHSGRNQTPLFMSTLREAVCFRISEPVESDNPDPVEL